MAARAAATRRSHGIGQSWSLAFAVLGPTLSLGEGVHDARDIASVQHVMCVVTDTLQRSESVPIIHPICGLQHDGSAHESASMRPGGLEETASKLHGCGCQGRAIA